MGAPLPYDKKTEDVVLGSVIHNPEDYDSVAKFFTNKDVFYQLRAQLLWKKLTEMKKEGQHIDTLTVCTSLSQEDIDLLYEKMEGLNDEWKEKISLSIENGEIEKGDIDKVITRIEQIKEESK